MHRNVVLGLIGFEQDDMLINTMNVMLQVQEVNVDEGVILVQFMVRHQPDLYRWDMSRQSTSWEDLQVFSQHSTRVLVELDELRSTKRWQLFSVLAYF